MLFSVEVCALLGASLAQLPAAIWYCLCCFPLRDHVKFSVVSPSLVHFSVEVGAFLGAVFVCILGPFPCFQLQLGAVSQLLETDELARSLLKKALLIFSDRIIIL